MKSYESFDHFIADQSPEHRRIIAALRALIAEAAPELTESVKWGNGCWVSGNLPIAYVHCEEDREHVQFGFFAGSLLKDPGQVLDGRGKYVRHIKVRSPRDIDEATIVPLLQQAVKTDYKAGK